MPQGVFAITEQRDGVFRKISFEAVSEGRRLADGLGADLCAVVVGSGRQGVGHLARRIEVPAENVEGVGVDHSELCGLHVPHGLRGILE